MNPIYPNEGEYVTDMMRLRFFVTKDTYMIGPLYHVRDSKRGNETVCTFPIRRTADLYAKSRNENE